MFEKSFARVLVITDYDLVAKANILVAATPETGEWPTAFPTAFVGNLSILVRFVYRSHYASVRLLSTHTSVDAMSQQIHSNNTV